MFQSDINRISSQCTAVVVVSLLPLLFQPISHFAFLNAPPNTSGYLYSLKLVADSKSEVYARLIKRTANSSELTRRLSIVHYGCCIIPVHDSFRVAVRRSLHQYYYSVQTLQEMYSQLGLSLGEQFSDLFTSNSRQLSLAGSYSKILHITVLRVYWEYS